MRTRPLQFYIRYSLIKGMIKKTISKQCILSKCKAFLLLQTFPFECG